MFVSYTPEDSPQDAQSWEFLPGRVRVSEQVIVEKQYGATWTEFVNGAKVGEAHARRVLLCHLLRREHPALQLRDTPDFFADELTVELSAAELEANRAEWESTGGPGRENGEAVAAVFAREIEEARAKYGESQGKAPSRSEPQATSG